MKRLALASLVFLLSALALAAVPDTSTYNPLWRKVVRAEQDGLPATALGLANGIYARARADANQPQLIKALLHRFKYQNQTGAVEFPAMIAQWEREMAEAPFPASALMHSMAAQMYWTYYEQNRWDIQQRTNTVGYKNDSIETWTENNFMRIIIEHIRISKTRADDLQKISTSEFEGIIQMGSPETEGMLPTLYDLLMSEALDIFNEYNSFFDFNSNPHFLLNDSLVRNVHYFSTMKVDVDDSLSFAYQSYLYYNEWLAYKNTQANPEAYLYVDVLRLEYFQKVSGCKNKGEIYLSSLQELFDQNKTKEMASFPGYYIAKYYQESGSLYNAFDPDTWKYRWDLKKANAMCNDVLLRFEDSNTHGTRECRDLRHDIETKAIAVENEKVVSPGKAFGLKINFTNFDTVYYRVYKFPFNYFYSYTLFEKTKPDTIMKHGIMLSEEMLVLPDPGDHQAHSSETIMKGLQPGLYIILFSGEKNFDSKYNDFTCAKFQVSNITYMRKSYSDAAIDFFVIGRQKGQSLAGVQFRLFAQENEAGSYFPTKKCVDSSMSDSKGFIRIEGLVYARRIAEFTNNGDTLIDKFDWSMYYNHRDEPRIEGHIFTDRAIYRPGQTIYFKGVCFELEEGSAVALYDREVTVFFYDSRWQAISSQKCKTDSLGSYEGSFAIPISVLNGEVTLSVDNAKATVMVEEYKRPKFSVQMNQPQGNYVLGDSITVGGKATTFAGDMLSGAVVKYSVELGPMTITHGTTTTCRDGRFIVSFATNNYRREIGQSAIKHNFMVKAEVTDLNGETQAQVLNVSVGSAPFDIENIVEKYQDRDSAFVMKSETKNASGLPVNTSGNIAIFKLKEPTLPLRSRMWNDPDTTMYSKSEWQTIFAGNEYGMESVPAYMKRGEIIYNQPFENTKSIVTSIKNCKNWIPGWYEVHVEARDSVGRLVTDSVVFMVFDCNTKKMPFATPHLFVPVATTCEPGQRAKIIVGSSHKVTLYVEVGRDNDTYSKTRITIHNEQKVIELPVEEKDRGNLSISVSYVYENRFYHDNQTITVPWSNKRLEMKFETFRDKLKAGEKEQWTLKIRHPKLGIVPAQLTATLYDATLDAFRKHSWDFFVYRTYQPVNDWEITSIDIDKNQQIQINNYYNWTSNTLNFEKIKIFQIWQPSPRSSAFGMEAHYLQAAPRKVNFLKSARASGNVVCEMADMSPSSPQSTVKTKPFLPRTNLSELAFFYPTLLTNDSGLVTINFTIPEALTTWRMLGFAHTRDMSYGFVENTLQTQKELMVMPNPPRFLREGDTVEFPAKVSNMSGKPLHGTARLQLFDALTMKPLDSLFVRSNASQQFAVDSGGNAIVLWKIAVPPGLEAVTWRATADCGSFADGEENSLPVLPNRMLVTETMPLPMSHKGTKTFTLDKLKNNQSTTLKTRSLTLEFTSNPAWYALQALPYLMEYPHECTEQTFSRFYANSLASHVVGSSPRLRQVFDLWAAAPDGKALLSKLEKNPDLKSILLQETPWVMEAQDETERQKRVALLFDLNRMTQELDATLAKLQEMQSASGAWPWFKGMGDNRYITQHIVGSIGHLQKLGVVNPGERPALDEMVDKAIAYLDAVLASDYGKLKAGKDFAGMKENYLGWNEVQYLYARGFYRSKAIAKEAAEAVDFYTKQAEKYWLTQARHGQGMIALAMLRAGKRAVTDKIVASISEHSLRGEEMGMYWNEPAGWCWYQNPVETQALMIELFADATTDTAAVNDMKLWLLKQKQTRDWKTTKATTEAVYALLLQGSDWLTGKKIAEIRVGSHTIDPATIDGGGVEAGTGYFRRSWAGADVKPEMATITVTNPNTSPAWGAAYWQYFEQLDKITPAASPLQIVRRLFVEQMTDGGAVISPLADTASLHVGDKVIVRLELRADRAMEFIHLKDMRASGFEPANVLSGYRWQGGLGYYQVTKDASTNLFIDYLPRGTYVMEYPLRVAQRGAFSVGITSVQSMYAPEFGSHSEGLRVRVK